MATTCWSIYADAIRERVDAMAPALRGGRVPVALRRLFKPDYLGGYARFRYSPAQVCVTNDNGKLNIRLTGTWREVIIMGSAAAAGRDQ